MTTLRVGSLCSGVGGLELALASIYDTEPVFFAETDEHASAVLAHHWPDVPNLGDLTQITDPPKCDVVAAGFPCQPHSLAGKQKGTDDARYIFPDVVRVWRDTGAPWLILENVPGLLTGNQGRDFAAVVDALAEAGATARWAHLRASSVGACHPRNRWFCVATAPDADRVGLERPRPPRHGRPGPADSRGGAVKLLPTPITQPTTGNGHARNLGKEVKLLPTPTASDPKASGSAAYAKTDTHSPGVTLTGATARGLVDFGDYAAAIARHEQTFGHPAPAATVDGRLSPRFVEWMQMYPPGWVTDIGLPRTQELRCLGNSVNPRQGAAALRLLGGLA